MNISLFFDAINLEWSIVEFEGSQVKFPDEIVFCKIVFVLTLSKQCSPWWNAVLYMWHFIWVFIVCQRTYRGGSRVSGKGVHIYKVGVCFPDFISFFLNIPWKWNNLVSLRPNYFTFVGYLKNGGGGWGGRGGGGGGGGGGRAKPLNSIWICHWPIMNH